MFRIVQLTYILPVLVLLATLPAAAQTATWWYPLGNMEATRQAGSKSEQQSATDLQIKWRTTALRNSPTVLVGAIQPADTSDSSQQVVGLFDGTLVILSSTGKRLSTETFERYFGVAHSVKLTLTGLFRPINSSPLGIGKPDIIGIGVERRPPAQLYGLLLNGNGSFYKKLIVNPDAQNQSIGVYPVAAYTPPSETSTNSIAIAVTSQESFQFPSTDSVDNGIRRYDLSKPTETDLQQQWLYRIAPRAYAQAPALLKDSRDSTLVSLSTEAYLSESAMIVNEGRVDQTISNIQYSVTVRVDSATRPLPH